MSLFYNGWSPRVPKRSTLLFWDPDQAPPSRKMLIRQVGCRGVIKSKGRDPSDQMLQGLRKRIVGQKEILSLLLGLGHWSSWLLDPSLPLQTSPSSSSSSSSSFSFSSSGLSLARRSLPRRVAWYSAQFSSTWETCPPGRKCYRNKTKNIFTNLT